MVPQPSNSSLERSKTTVGDSDVTSMSFEAFRNSTLNVEKLVLTVSRLAAGKEASASTVQLVESLVWPFVSRRSLFSGGPFSDKEFRRFVHSMKYTADQIKRYTSTDNKEQSFIKFWLDTFMCKLFLDPALPPRPTWLETSLFSGWCRRFLNRALARRDSSFIYSLSKGSKMMWPRLGDEKELAALQGHRAILSTPQPIVPLDVIVEIRKTSNLVFRVGSAGPPIKFMPSPSACVQVGRAGGGALSLFEPLVPETGSLGALRHLEISLESWRSATYNEALIGSEEQARRGDALRVEVQAIPEPGKFRIITKGDGYLYTALQPLQGMMLSCWKSRLESTMRSGDLTESIRRLDKALPYPGWLWRSGDYEKATDYLARDATIAAFSACSWMPGSDLGSFSLGRASASYPQDVGLIPDVQYEEGQLMGHPLSFPLLCVINLACYRLAISRWISEGASPDELAARIYVGGTMRENVIVNGDDILFKSEDSFYRIWLRTVKEVGFRISLGKSYSSPDVCLINSQLFRRVGGLMQRFGYLNLRLVKGNSLKGGESQATPTQIGKDLSEMVRLCPWTNCSIPAAFGRWREDWFMEGFKPNWYLPVHLGGFGLSRAFAPVTLSFSRQQRLMAARFVADPRMALYRRAGMNLFATRLAGALMRWRMIPDVPYVPVESETEDSDDWLARCALVSMAMGRSSQVSDRVFTSRFSPSHRLSPMSVEALERYWNVRLFATRVAPCPPLNVLRILPANVWF
nr:MAG: putative RNA-dependent RNA polymerase [Narnaviridae sp.]